MRDAPSHGTPPSAGAQVSRKGLLKAVQFDGTLRPCVLAQGSSPRYRHWIVRTPFGLIPLRLGDWIVTTRKGEVSTCPDGIFQQLFEVF
jgi:hypothetical protein